jgi:hypothetical protein
LLIYFCRLKGLDSCQSRFKRWIGTNNDSGHAVQLEDLLDICIKLLSDPNQKVASQSYSVIESLSSTQNSLIASKLGVLLPILFARMSDRKAVTRTQANELLDAFRSVYDPCTLTSILSPKLTEIPDRTLVLVIQYLVTICPLCGSYFSQPQNTYAFLNRLAMVLSPVKRPSTALSQSGQRLLDLVYKASPEV